MEYALGMLTKGLETSRGYLIIASLWVTRVTSKSARFSTATKPFLTIKEKGYPIRGLDRSLGLQKIEALIISGQ